MDPANPRDLAKLYHDTYERLAPDFGIATFLGYTTDAQEFDEQSPKGNLMIAVFAEMIKAIAAIAGQELFQSLDFHPRAWRLMQKRKPFIVIAEDEPYYLSAYALIRSHERTKGTWTGQDEAAFLQAFESEHTLKLKEDTQREEQAERFVEGAPMMFVCSGCKNETYSNFDLSGKPHLECRFVDGTWRYKPAE